MTDDWTLKKILLVVIGVIVLIWLIKWLTDRNKVNPVVNQPPYNLQPGSPYFVSQQQANTQNMAQQLAPQLAQQPVTVVRQQMPLPQQPVTVVRQQMSPQQPVTIVRQQMSPQQYKQPITVSPKLAPQLAPYTNKPIIDTRGGIQQLDTPFVLYYFYTNNCKHCTNFKPIWNNIVDRFRDNNNIVTSDIDVSNPENENLAFYYNITRTPTVILVTPENNIEYNGNNMANDLYNFVMTYVNQYLQNVQPQQNQYIANDNQYMTDVDTIYC